MERAQTVGGVELGWDDEGLWCCERWLVIRLMAYELVHKSLFNFQCILQFAGRKLLPPM